MTGRELRLESTIRDRHLLGMSENVYIVAMMDCVVCVNLGCGMAGYKTAIIIIIIETRSLNPALFVEILCRCLPEISQGANHGSPFRPPTLSKNQFERQLAIKLKTSGTKLDQGP